MKARLLLVLFAALSGSAWAEADCHQPMSTWQPRDAVLARVAAQGIHPTRLRIADGCYEAQGRDVDGNAVELRLDPTSLSVLSLEVQFRPGANPARYLPPGPRPPARPAAPAAAPFRP